MAAREVEGVACKQADGRDPKTGELRVTTKLKLPKSAKVKFPSQGAANSFRGACPPERKQSKIPSDFLPKEARVG